MIELLIVTTILCVVAALTLPSMMHALAGFRLRTKATSLAALLQQARSAAVKQNAPAGLSLSGDEFWVDTNRNGAKDAKEVARLPLPANLSIVSSGQPASLDVATLGAASGTTINIAGSTTPVYFNARGIPCPYNSTSKTCNASTTNTAYVYYLQETSNGGSWAAVSVSPAGRIKVWNWNGSAWK